MFRKLANLGVFIDYGFVLILVGIGSSSPNGRRMVTETFKVRWAERRYEGRFGGDLHHGITVYAISDEQRARKNALNNQQ
jgi:hypothetical protein